MDKDKQKQELFLIGRILSMEALLLLMGTVSFIYGILKEQILQILLGAAIISITFFIVNARSRRGQ